MKDTLIELAKANGADLVGFAPASRFPEDSAIFKIMPQTKTVIGMAFRILRGAYRGIEEGTTYYQYTTMGVQNMEEVVMPMAMMRVSMALETQGYLALPQQKNQLIMAEPDSTNPEVHFDWIHRNKTQEVQMDFLDAAIKCGLGEKSMHGTLLTDAFGPMVRYCFILTDAELEPTEEVAPHLCDKCGKCVAACPGKAISKEGKVDAWQCAVYYNGANGTKNPYMQPDALAEYENRIEIIAGEAEISPELAKKLLKDLFFYPPEHAYPCSICGRACDLACYIHLEEKGVLTKKFRTNFRKRPEWRFPLDDFR